MSFTITCDVSAGFLLIFYQVDIIPNFPRVLFIYFWLCWLFVAALRIFLVEVCELLVLAYKFLVASFQCLVPWPGIEPGPLVLGMWSLSHWSTKEVLLEVFFFLIVNGCRVCQILFCVSWWDYDLSKLVGIWWVMLIDFKYWNPTWSWYIMLTYCYILIANILLRIFVLKFMGDVSL